MSVICGCAVVVCGGNHCPVKASMRKFEEAHGRPPNPSVPCEVQAVVDQFYVDTAHLYQKNCAYRDEERKRCCRKAVAAEFRQIHASGTCADEQAPA